MPGRHPMVSRFELYQTAGNYQGSADYGATANSLLRYKTQLLGRGHVWLTPATASLYMVSHFKGVPLGTYAPDPGLIANKAREMQPDLPYMLTVRTVPDNDPWQHDPEKGIRLFDVEQGEISRAGLAAFLKDRQYDQHTLHGAFGKAIDTLCIVAGVVDPEALPSRTHEGEFVRYADFATGLEQSSLPKYHQQKALRAVTEQARTQLRDMRPGPTQDGEFIFEGPVAVKSGMQFAYEQIARSSLAESLPHRFAADSPAVAYLHETYGQ